MVNISPDLRRTSSLDEEFRVPAGSASRPISKFWYRLCAPLRWWSCSTLRIVVEEFYKFPLRISAILKTPRLRDGVPIPLSPLGSCLENFPEENDWLLACTAGMQQLRKQHPWIATLEVQMCFQAFQQGAAWSLRNVDRQNRTESQQS